MATEVAVIAATTGVVTYYSTYAAARSASNSGDTIEIWADLDEQIILKDSVDIRIIPGRVLDMSDELATITDNGDAVNCNIFGSGIIKNSYAGPEDNRYECIRISNSESKVSIQCDTIEGIGAIFDPWVDANQGVSVLIEGIADTQSFSLVCNKVKNTYNSAIVFGTSEEGNISNNVFIKAKTIETGLFGDSSGLSAMIIKGTGFLEIEEVICNDKGSCLVHQTGNITANILKMTTYDLDSPVIKISEGDGTQVLQLYFDEIQNLNNTSGDAVVVTQGVANLIGRRIFSNKGNSLDLTGNITRANIQCVEIISGTKGINIANSYDPIIIDANYIEGKSHNSTSGVISCDTHSNIVLRNAKIKNISSANGSVGIYIDSQNNHQIEIENLIVVTNDLTNGKTIYKDGNNLDIKNLLVFLNKSATNITFLIGTDTNKKVIVSDQIT